jgi:hypothetical protein
MCEWAWRALWWGGYKILCFPYTGSHLWWLVRANRRILKSEKREGLGSPWFPFSWSSILTFLRLSIAVIKIYRQPLSIYIHVLSYSTLLRSCLFYWLFNSEHPGAVGAVYAGIIDFSRKDTYFKRVINKCLDPIFQDIRFRAADSLLL